MQLRHLRIENFRGIKELDLDLGDTTVLIGENNTGKTTVLDALTFALRDVRSRRVCAFDPYDFHLPTATSTPSSAPQIRLELTFREDKPGEWGDDCRSRLTRAGIFQLGEQDRGVVRLQVTAQYNENENAFGQDWQFLNINGDPLVAAQAYALDILRQEVEYIYVPALRDAARDFSSRGSFWRPFLSESHLSADGISEIEAKLGEVNELILASHGALDQVVACLQDIGQVMVVAGGAAPVAIDVIPPRVGDMLKGAQVNVSAETGAKVPVERHGAGTQSLAVLMLVNAYLQALQGTSPQGTSPIVALEEPEAHLHPGAVRSLWALIQRIPGQKMISTHSGDFLAEVSPEDVVRLYRKAGETRAGRIPRWGPCERQRKQQRHFETHIRATRAELLFARCWVLCEGLTEATLIPGLAQHMGVDLGRAGIGCVTYAQSGGVELYIRAADELGIQWIALCDNDVAGTEYQDVVRKHLNGREADQVLYDTVAPDIEQYLCRNGLGLVYESLQSNEKKANIDESPNIDDYWRKVCVNTGKKKIAAVPEVLKLIDEGKAPVPDLLARVIKASLALAEGE